MQAHDKVVEAHNASEKPIRELLESPESPGPGTAQGSPSSPVSCGIFSSPGPVSPPHGSVCQEFSEGAHRKQLLMSPRSMTFASWREPDGNPSLRPRSMARSFSPGSWCEFSASFTSDTTNSFLEPSASPRSVASVSDKHTSTTFVPVVLDKTLERDNEKLQVQVHMLSEEKKKRFDWLRKVASEQALEMIERERKQQEKNARFAEGQLKAVKDELLAAQEDLDEVTKALEATQRDLKMKEVECASLKDALQESQKKLSVKDAECETLNEGIAEKNKLLEERDAECLSLSNTLKQKDTQVEEKDAECQKLRELATKLTETLNVCDCSCSTGDGRRRRRGGYVSAPFAEDCYVSL